MNPLHYLGKVENFHNNIIMHGKGFKLNSDV